MFDREILQLPGAKKVFVLLIISSFIQACLAGGQAICLALALFGLWEGSGIESQIVFLGGFLACLIARKIIEHIRLVGMDAFASDYACGLRRSLAEAYFEGGPAFAKRIGTGASATSLVEGVDHVETYLSLAVPKLAAVMVEPLVILVVLVWADWPSALIAAVVLPCVILYMRLLGRNARAAAERRHDEYTSLANHFVDSLRGITTLKTFGRTTERTKEVFTVSERFREATVATLRTATLSSLVLDLFATFALAAASILLGFRLLGGSIELFYALAALLLVPECFAPVLRFASDFHATLDGKNALKAINAIIGEAQNNAHDMSAACVAPWDEHSFLKVSHVSLAYKERNDHTPYDASSESLETEALCDISFEAQGYQRIGIVGVSGAGKSTLSQVLAGFALPNSGQIYQNGTPCELTSPSWHSQVCYIPQHPYIFKASLRDNIAFYCPQAPDEQVYAALEAAGLSEFVNELPMGLDTLIGDGGRGLSGGQAQRIALARAFLDGDSRKVLIFDEPTAHLDIETEYALKAPMKALMQDRLVFFATHRLHWMRDMDRILVLDNGRLVEEGSYDELISYNGTFACLVRELRGGDAA